MVTREAMVAAARSFVGTPYHHQASCKLGAKVDDAKETKAQGAKPAKAK
jgi:hypothetical protein